MTNSLSVRSSGKCASTFTRIGTKNVYWCPHGFSKPRRKKQYAVLPALLWSDMDEAHPNLQFKPTIAIESSPDRYVGIWECDATVSEGLNRRLTYHIGADKGGWDLTQVLRTPGTLNYKYDPPPPRESAVGRRPRISCAISGAPIAAHRAATTGSSIARPRNCANWRKLSGPQLAYHYGVRRSAFSSYWNKRFIVIQSVWGPMVRRGASLEEVKHALAECPAYLSKVEEHGETWQRGEINRIANAMEKQS